MNRVSDDRQPESLYELSWNNAQDSTFAVDTGTGIVVAVNPAAEALMGYSRQELIGMHLTALHPEAEREQVKAEFGKIGQQPLSNFDFHVQRKDGHLVPIAIWASASLRLAGRRVVIAELRDITELQQREHLLKSKKWALAAYAGAALALGHSRSSDDLLKSICEAITRESVYVLACVVVTDEGPGNPDKIIHVAAAAGGALSYLEGLYLTWKERDPRGAGPLGIGMRTGEPQIMQDTETYAAFEPWRDRARQSGVRSGAVIPFPMEGNRRGALLVYSGRTNAFEPVAIEVFRHLAEQIGHGIHAFEQEQLLISERKHLARMKTELTEALSAMVAPIVLAMEMRDPYTTGHQSRVAEIAVAIGREMGWSEEQLQGLRVAAQVHDIGKISIPAEILTKPGQLNPAERAMINEHAEIGYTILKDIPFPWPIAEIVRQHHEKLDGSGYPRGLKGGEILPEAKVLTVADIVEAMASYRPYRRGVKLHAVLQTIEKDAGTLLDPETVRVCVALLREKRLVVPGWNRR